MRCQGNQKTTSRNLATLVRRKLMLRFTTETSSVTKLYLLDPLLSPLFHLGHFPRRAASALRPPSRIIIINTGCLHQILGRATPAITMPQPFLSPNLYPRSLLPNLGDPHRLGPCKIKDPTSIFPPWSSNAYLNMSLSKHTFLSA
jgi:hypothetical protein